MAKNGRTKSDFAELFRKATGNSPFGFQKRFAETLPSLVKVPTGAGKTAMAFLGWLWRRRFADQATRDATPRRLVYCLPMRVLVEQTRENVIEWLDTLSCLGGNATFNNEGGKRRLASYSPAWDANSGVTVSVLMGGEDRDEWDLHPEHDAVIIGTQDMLLSRALNRGYGMSRFRWPMQFALLNNDALWAFDEIQLMGSGLATTAQLNAFRSAFGTTGSTRSIWMSATLEPTWLKTVDFCPPLPGDSLALTEADTLESLDLRARMNADKPLHRAAASIGTTPALAKEILAAHQPASRTLVVVNTVTRAIDLWRELKKPARGAKPAEPSPRIVLLHSRFRPAERAAQITALLEEPTGAGAIVVSTQVVEAGVDVSAKVMFTELAPWASLVQRFGRCNRRGIDAGAKVYWIDWPEDVASGGGEKKRDDLAMPYAAEDLVRAAGLLRRCENVGPNRLPQVELPYKHTHVIRRKDFVELFDTTPDLAGNDIDVSRYVREIEDSGVQVFWRDLEGRADLRKEPFPRRQELCSVQASSFRTFLGKLRKKDSTARLRAYRRNYLDGTWEVAGDDAIYPGQVLMLDVHAGGYDSESGWTGEPGGTVNSLLIAVPLPSESEADGALGDDALSIGRKWQSIAQHTDDVCAELDTILRSVEVPHADILRVAARWHDRGKAHRTFQDAAALVVPDAADATHATPYIVNREVAKTGGESRLQYKRDGRAAPHFRHELASALAILHPDSGLPSDQRDLVAYLSGGHHGKVRLSIRSMPEELRPNDGRHYARGIWDRDELPTTDLGNRVRAPAITLWLDPMALGTCEDKNSPFFGEASWSERMLGLRDRADLGPFRLGFLESLLRAADQRASGSPSVDPAQQEEPNG